MIYNVTRILQNSKIVNRCSIFKKQRMLKSPLWGQTKATFLEGGLFTYCRLVKHLLSLSGEGEGRGKTKFFLTKRH